MYNRPWIPSSPSISSTIHNMSDKSTDTKLNEWAEVITEKVEKEMGLSKGTINRWHLEEMDRIESIYNKKSQ